MKIATIEKISTVRNHPNADRLDLVKVLGFQCVTGRGNFVPGQLVVFVQPDSVLPNLPWAEEFKRFCPTRIKSAKLRGEWSDGLILNPAHLGLIDIYEGMDVSEILGIEHYVPPAPVDMSAKGSLPFGIPKTDEERWENLPEHELAFGHLVDITQKIDGQSWTAYYNRRLDQFGVCGRTLEFKDGVLNNYTRHAELLDVKHKLRKFCIENDVSLAIRGESYGKGIQTFAKNPHSLRNPGLALFSIFNIDTHQYERKGDRFYILDLAEKLELPTVPVIERNVIMSPEIIQKYSREQDTLFGEPYEGVVVQHERYSVDLGTHIADIDGGSYKIINMSYDSAK